jgi:uncharacterized protein YfaP (DUF2135 family)
MPTVLLAMALLPVLADSIRFETPLGGWRPAPEEGANYTQSVHYPAASVNLDAHQSRAAMVRGQIDAAPKPAKKAKRSNADEAATPNAPGRLTINGASMPLAIDESGGFGRPYAFGSGSNGVEVSAAGARKRVQFYQTNGTRAQAKLRVILSWDSNGTDLDLHVVSPTGNHTWYGNRVSPDGGALDVDVTTGYGPEIYSNPSPEHGTYLVYVNYYGSGENRDALTVADVTVVSNENTPAEKKQFFRAPMRKAGELTLISSFVY